MFVGEKSDPQRFNSAGINFKAKLIGVEDVAQANGDRMCQEAIHRLKGSVKDSGGHKLRLVINVSMNGMKLIEEKTGVGSFVVSSCSPIIVFILFSCPVAVFLLFLKDKLYEISSDTHQLQFMKLHHFKLERFKLI